MLISTFFIFVLIIFFGIHLGYPLLLRRISRKATKLMLNKNADKSCSHSELPYVSIIIPVYNEQAVIRQRINNIFESDYPKNKLELIVVDSGSNDETRLIIESQFLNSVILVTEQERHGKAHAINLGLQKCKGEFIILTDGTTRYDRDTIKQLVYSFADATVGAVSATYNVPNKEESHVSESEHEFWSYKDEIRLLESSTHSTSWLSGEACAFRRKIIERVHEDTLADDSNIALQVISKGYRVIVNQNAQFTERSPTQFLDYFRIKSRRALGGLIETIRFKSFLFNQDYRYFGTVIFPYRFFVCLLSPILSCLLIGLAVPTISEVVSIIGFYYTLFMVIVLISILFIFKKVVMTYLYTQLITIIAVIWLLGGKKDVLWTRSKSR